MERGAKVSGARFYFLTGPGALLEFALAQLAISRAVAAGFTPVVAPALVKPEAMEGTGFLGEHDEEVYRIERDDLYLVGTSEVALAGMHAKRGARPLRRPPPLRRLVVLLPPRGRLLRQGHPRHHPRALVRQGRDVQLLPPEEAAAEHLRLLQWEEEFLQALELPYRVVDIAAGDLGTSAARKYDIEAWFPTPGHLPRADRRRRTARTFQARRLTIRYRDADGKPQTAATLNGTLCAIARTIACLLEVHQRADGSVHVPGRRCGRGSAASRPLTPGMTLAAAGPAARMSRRPPKALKAYGVLPDADRVVDLGRDLGGVAAEARRHRPRRHAAQLGRRGQPAHPGGARPPAGTPASRSSASPAAARGCSTASATALDGRGIAVLAQGGFVVDLERDEVLRTVGLPRDHAPGA